MNIHEHQAKELFKQYGIAVPNGKVAYSVEEAVAAGSDLKTSVKVVKAQIHAGGRGKGGGVKLAKSDAELKEHASSILGMQLVTHQTGPEGKKVGRLWIEEGSAIAKELYMALLVDRDTSTVTFIASTEGGMDIEEVSAKTPEKIGTVSIDPVLGLQAFHARKLATILSITDKDLQKQLFKFAGALYKFAIEKDCSLVEINPLVITEDNRLVALDAKVNFDDNALYRHPEIEELRDPTEETEAELEAHKYDLAFISLDGNVGCMVNGAGLAMATMDVIELAGESPANFLDVGGGATKEKVQAAFKIILSDPKVKGILVNIFGGIMKCDVIAEGIIAAAKEMEIKVPLVVRLEGTNVEEGKKLLGESALKITPADDLDDAGKKVAAAVKGA